jgi:hypothetical protein
MPATNRQQQTTEQKLLQEAALIAWKQCLEENGLEGAMGCAHLAAEAGRAFVRELLHPEPRNEVKQP